MAKKAKPLPRWFGVALLMSGLVAAFSGVSLMKNPTTKLKSKTDEEKKEEEESNAG